MRALARHLFTLCAVVSLLLCVAVCVLWVRSYAVRDVWHQHMLPTVRGSSEVASDSGMLWWQRHVRPGTEYEKHILGFYFYAGNNLNAAGVTFSTRAWAVPYWAPLAVTAVLPVWWGGRWLRQRRASSRGLCPTCGYDLRASPERCPECGAAATVCEA